MVLTELTDYNRRSNWFGVLNVGDALFVKWWTNDKPYSVLAASVGEKRNAPDVDAPLVL